MSDETQELDGEYLRDNAREVALMDQANRRNLILKSFAVAQAACDAALQGYEHLNAFTNPPITHGTAAPTIDLGLFKILHRQTLKLCDRSVEACDAATNLLNSQRDIR